MKTLGRLNINSERLMKHEELITLRGGYGYVSCRIGSVHCGGASVSNCGQAARDKCDDLCSGWDNFVCAGI